MAWTLSFSAQGAPWWNGLEGATAVAGGKGANLAYLCTAGLPVPEGFILSTRAYREYVNANGLQKRIEGVLEGARLGDPAVLEAVSAKIRAWFRDGAIPQEAAAAVCAAYQGMGGRAVAVRSSATAEDLPEMSFAGQQDTYLNVAGEESLLRAVVECWSSLWTARAIGYRARNGVAQMEAALAVVVQRMVESQVSGVLFTANPVSGLRNEVVIDAAYGLGEGLVSGRVEPDHYVVEARSGQVTAKRLGSKALSIHGAAGGGTREEARERGAEQALADEEIRALGALALRIATLYQAPQDVEWAWVKGCFFILQSRAVTSLYPIPAGIPPEPLQVLFSLGAVQGMLDPFTPLGRDILKELFAAGSRLFGINVQGATQRILWEAGDRLWINLTTLMRNSAGRRVVRVALDQVEPGTGQALAQVLNEPRLQPERRGIRLHALRQIARFALPLAGNIARNIRAPARRRAEIVQAGEDLLAEMQARCQALPEEPRARIAGVLALLDSVITESLPTVLARFVSLIAAGMACFNGLRFLAAPQTPAARGAWPAVVLEISRGMPNNPTTQMDLDLWNTARAIRQDADVLALFRAQAPADLANVYLAGGLPPLGQRRLDAFLDRYGGRGLAEIDIGRARWAEDPRYIFDALAGYLQIEDADRAPDAVFARGAEASVLAEGTLVGLVARTRGGWFKQHAVHFFAGRVRAMLGARESPKFFAVRLLSIVRAELLRAGVDLTRAGVLDQPDDVFFLTRAELAALSVGQPAEWKTLAAASRAAYTQELRRKQIPRLLLSDGRAFYEGVRADTYDPVEGKGNFLSGCPVSPGSAEGTVRVVLDPRQADLLPGEILVCPGTDPSWTPLFLTAAGLVMEVGGMMTHGAVVAREYGIPAVVGVDQAVQRLRTGQRVRLDGSTGRIEMLDER
jgi:pyruvate,water dikinase